MNSNGSKFRPPGAGLFTVMGNDPVVAPFARLARVSRITGANNVNPVAVTESAKAHCNPETEVAIRFRDYPFRSGFLR